LECCDRSHSTPNGAKAQKRLPQLKLGRKVWEASPLGGASGKPDADQKCAVRSYLLTALERSGDLSHIADGL